jgi:hypothetical protein
MNWGMAQTPPLFKKAPFHRFGVRMNKKLETTRDRRLTRDQEKRLLDTALQKMNAPEHQFVGPLLHDRIIGAIELVCRRGEMLLIQNPARELGDLSDWDSRRHDEGQGEPANSVQPGRTSRGNPEETLSARGRTRSSSDPRREPTSRTSRPPGKTLRLLANRLDPKPVRERN